MVCGDHLAKICKLMRTTFYNLENKTEPTYSTNLKINDVYERSKVKKKKSDFVPRSNFYYFIEDIILENKNLSVENVYKKCLGELQSLNKFQRKILKKEIKKLNIN
ncbi:hypothetical protein TUBRATIS_10600 [Tubulinosema ratisbonensis]|uniref:Uncharacterized protein n=1 Tax=Tubulinosema ratisbonensis TaxID=291195 RepID=A0A437AN32_9MICR|nr:hypothetical protein TUBRATIS_10600 [Tubulinosema ratisbonensis]